MKALESIMDAIGNTPLVRIAKRDGQCPARLFAKLEFMNPGGSVKDRLVKYLVERMIRPAFLGPNTEIADAELLVHEVLAVGEELSTQ